MASATGTRAALLFSFSAILFLFLLLQAPAAPAPGHAVADLVISALDRLLDWRGLLEMATRRNMILLCHVILLLILMDAGVLGAPARRRRTPPGEATAVAAAGTEIIACSAAAQAPAARPHDATRSAVVVWRRRRPRNRAVAVVVAPVHEHNAAGRVVDDECRPAVEAVVTWPAVPIQTTGPPAQAAEEAATAVATKQIVLVEPPRDDDGDLLDRHDLAAVVEQLERPTAIAADGETDCDDRRIITVAADEKRMDTAGEHQTAGTGMEMEMELADDRTFEEFIESQRRQMRQESLQLFRSGYHHQAIATCY